MLELSYLSTHTLGKRLDEQQACRQLTNLTLFREFYVLQFAVNSSPHYNASTIAGPGRGVHVNATT